VSSSALTSETSTELTALSQLVQCGGVVILSGAGLSTESGIPDYRGPDGTRRVTPMQYSEFISSPAARQRYWARSFVGWQRFSLAEPNRGHRAVARLQELGLVDGIITQNVDGLHQDAGAHRVIELHGSLQVVVCLTCGERSSRRALHERMDSANPLFTDRVRSLVEDGSRVSSQIRPDGDILLDGGVITAFRMPLCLVCGRDTLKPDVVFFGESVPKNKVEQSFDVVARSSSLLVLGSSLAVMSGYRFVRRAARDGIPVAIVASSPTRGDAEATVRLHSPLGETLHALVTDVAERSGKQP